MEPPGLASALAEIVYEFVKATRNEEENPLAAQDPTTPSLLVRIKTYKSCPEDQQQLLCHCKVFSSRELPVVELLREKKLRHLTQFLLHVQRRQGEDCHCVLKRTFLDPTTNNPEGHAAAQLVTSSESLTLLLRQQRFTDPLRDVPGRSPCYGDSESRNGDTAEGEIVPGSGDCAGRKKEVTGLVGEPAERRDCFVRRGDSVEVTSARLEDTPVEEGGEGGSCKRGGIQLHIRFSSGKEDILKESKTIHDFLHRLKLFHPKIEVSFVFNIEEQASRASYRFQGFTEFQGHCVVTDPKYFAEKSSLSSRAFLGCAVKEGAGFPPSARALCVACHVTQCRHRRHQQRRARATVGPNQGVLSIDVFGPYGVPCLMTTGDVVTSLRRALTTGVQWQRFGLQVSSSPLTSSAVSSASHGSAESGECGLAVIQERSSSASLPSWVGDDDQPFVLSLNLLFASSLHDHQHHHRHHLQHVNDDDDDDAADYFQAQKFVGDVLNWTPRKEPGDFSAPAAPNAASSSVCEVVTAALMDLYQVEDPPGSQHQQPRKATSSHLDRLLPLISRSLAEIYTRSYSQSFREFMQMMAQTDNGRNMESTLQQRLRSIMVDPTTTSSQWGATPTPAASKPPPPPSSSSPLNNQPPSEPDHPPPPQQESSRDLASLGDDDFAFPQASPSSPPPSSSLDATPSHHQQHHQHHHRHHHHRHQQLEGAIYQSGGRHVSCEGFSLGGGGGGGQVPDESATLIGAENEWGNHREDEEEGEGGETEEEDGALSDEESWFSQMEQELAQ